MANKPTHIVWHVREGGTDGEESKSYWTRIGVAWENKDGKGLNGELNLFPQDGRFVIRELGDGQPER